MAVLANIINMYYWQTFIRNPDIHGSIDLFSSKEIPAKTLQRRLSKLKTAGSLPCVYVLATDMV